MPVATRSGPTRFVSAERVALSLIQQVADLPPRPFGKRRPCFDDGRQVGIDRHQNIGIRFRRACLRATRRKSDCDFTCAVST